MQGETWATGSGKNKFGRFQSLKEEVMSTSPWEAARAVFPDLGRIVALIEKLRRDLGDDAIDLILRDKTHLVRVGTEGIEARSRVRKLFDRNGYRVREARMHDVAIADNLARLLGELWRPYTDEEMKKIFVEYLPPKVAAYPDAVASLLDRLAAARSRFRADPEIGNLFKGPYVPILLPSVMGDKSKPYDCSDEFWRFCAQVGETWRKVAGGWIEEHTTPAQTPMGQHVFGQKEPESPVPPVYTASESGRQQVVLDRQSQGEMVVGYWFPFALPGYSALAARQQMSYLPFPEELVLAGPLEILTGITMYSQFLQLLNPVEYTAAGWDLEFRGEQRVLSLTARGHFRANMSLDPKPETARDLSSCGLFLMA